MINIFLLTVLALVIIAALAAHRLSKDRKTDLESIADKFGVPEHVFAPKYVQYIEFGTGDDQNTESYKKALNDLLEEEPELKRLYDRLVLMALNHKPKL